MLVPIPFVWRVDPRDPVTGIRYWILDTRSPIADTILSSATVGVFFVLRQSLRWQVNICVYSYSYLYSCISIYIYIYIYAQVRPGQRDMGQGR